MELWKDDLKEELIHMIPQKLEIFVRTLVKEMCVERDEKIRIQY